MPNQVKLLGEDDAVLLLQRVEPAPTEPYAYTEPDIALNVDVRVRAFAATVQAWIFESAWRTFLAELNTLEQIRRGQATLQSVSPEELRLAIRSTDSAGHMLIEGVVGRRAMDGHTLTLGFSFPFDPGALASFVRELNGL